MERSVENAQQMVKDMLKDMTQTKLSDTIGINQVTLANLKNAKAKRITDKVWNRLEKAYDSRKSIDTGPMPEKPKKKAKPAKKAKAQTEPQIVKKINSMIAELEELKKQVEPLVELQKVIKKMK
jgi:DNA-binding Xre family transcriptional regulator